MDELGLHNLVVYDNKGRPDSIRYELMSLYLLEVIKDQANSVEELKTQNESLKHRLDALERTVQQFANGKEVQL